ncbi:TPA: hypothetical protein DF272_05620 [Candidatus Falkowbacteria bacterium]|nr:hypothetical protein [Candidatus Falkowbacteria bacterium]
MEATTYANYSRALKSRWPSILVITLLFLLVSLVVTLVQPFQYESQVKILVIQKSAGTLDAYSASKSAERIGNNLSQVIYSSSFYTKVMNSGFDINQDYFSADEGKRRDFWTRIVDADVPSGTTILEISTFHRDRNQATVLAQAIAYVLIRESDEYIGISDVELKVVDAPLTSEYPVKPNFVLNVLFGVLLGLLVSIIYVLITYSEDDEARDVFRPHDKRQERWERKQRIRQLKEANKADRRLVESEKKQASVTAIPTIVSMDEPVPEPIRVEKIKKRNEELAAPDLYAVFDRDNKEAFQPDKVQSKPIEDKVKIDREKTVAPVSQGKKSFENLPAFESEDSVKTVFDQ